MIPVSPPVRSSKREKTCYWYLCPLHPTRTENSIKKMSCPLMKTHRGQDPLSYWRNKESYLFQCGRQWLMQQNRPNDEKHLKTRKRQRWLPHETCKCDDVLKYLIWSTTQRDMLCIKTNSTKHSVANLAINRQKITFNETI